MNLYWFNHVEGEHWKIIAALNEERAWELLAVEGSDSLTIERAKQASNLLAVTAVSENEGDVAKMNHLDPLVVEVTIRSGFGSETVQYPWDHRESRSASSAG